MWQWSLISIHRWQQISEAPASENSHLGRGETHIDTHIQIIIQYQHAKKQKNKIHTETRHAEIAALAQAFFCLFFDDLHTHTHTHTHTHGRCHRYCPYTPARNYIHNSFYLHNLLVYTHETIMLMCQHRHSSCTVQGTQSEDDHTHTHTHTHTFPCLSSSVSYSIFFFFFFFFFFGFFVFVFIVPFLRTCLHIHTLFYLSIGMNKTHTQTHTHTHTHTHTAVVLTIRCCQCADVLRDVSCEFRPCCWNVSLSFLTLTSISFN